MSGYYAGPDVFIIDGMGLGDALLARLPAIADPLWRIGHYRRTIPDGYKETLSTGEPSFLDQSLGQYYSYLLKIIRGPLFTRERWKLIWRFNTGYYNHLIKQCDYAYPNRQKVLFSQLDQGILDGTTYDAPGTVEVTNDGVDILFDGIRHQSSFNTSVDNNDSYIFTFYLGQKRLAALTVPASYRSEGLNTHLMKVPDKAWKTGYDHILIMPGHGDGKYGLGNVNLNP